MNDNNLLYGIAMGGAIEKFKKVEKIAGRGGWPAKISAGFAGFKEK